MLNQPDRFALLPTLRAQIRSVGMTARATLLPLSSICHPEPTSEGESCRRIYAKRFADATQRT